MKRNKAKARAGRAKSAYAKYRKAPYRPHPILQRWHKAAVEGDHRAREAAAVEWTAELKRRRFEFAAQLQEI